MLYIVSVRSMLSLITLQVYSNCSGTDVFASVIQLVVAALLIVLAVIIAINSLKSYVHSKKNSEVEEKTETAEA